MRFTFGEFVLDCGTRQLLRSGSEVAERSAALLGDLVLSPILFVGAAILYLDQSARLRMRSSKLESPTQEA